VGQRCCVQLCGGDEELLEERVRQGAPQPRAASRSAGAFPFERKMSLIVWDGAQIMDISSL